MDTEHEEGCWGAETPSEAGNVRPRLVSVTWVFPVQVFSSRLFPMSLCHSRYVTIMSRLLLFLVIPDIIPGLCDQIKLWGRREFQVGLWCADPLASSVNWGWHTAFELPQGIDPVSTLCSVTCQILIGAAKRFFGRMIWSEPTLEGWHCSEICVEIRPYDDYILQSQKTSYIKVWKY